MKLLFLGSVIKTEDCTKYLGPSVAGNKMQLGIIKALNKHFKDNLTVLSEYPIASYPREKQVFINNGTIGLNKHINAKKVPFINVILLKQVSKIINAFTKIKKWSQLFPGENKVIICFNSFPEIALPVLLAKKLFGIRVVCILADLPIDVVERKLFGKYLKKLEGKITKISIKKFDALIALNENAIDIYSPDASYVIVDGGFDIEDTPRNPCGGQWSKMDEKEPLKVIFSGALYEYNGIVSLLDAAKSVKNPRFSLEIYGSGPLEDYVKQFSNNNSKVNFMGNVSNAEMLKIQQEAALLVNPRKINDPISKVTFPSKMIEYLLSGTPVVTTKLNGFTEEYMDYMFTFDNNHPETIAKTIDEILLKPSEELIDLTIRSREFIKNNKNWEVQSKKIIDLLNNL